MNRWFPLALLMEWRQEPAAWPRRAGRDRSGSSVVAGSLRNRRGYLEGAGGVCLTRDARFSNIGASW